MQTRQIVHFLFFVRSNTSGRWHNPCTKIFSSFIRHPTLLAKASVITVLFDPESKRAYVWRPFSNSTMTGKIGRKHFGLPALYINSLLFFRSISWYCFWKELMKPLAVWEVSMIWSGQPRSYANNFSFWMWYFIYERNNLWNAATNGKFGSSSMRPSVRIIFSKVVFQKHIFSPNIS